MRRYNASGSGPLPDAQPMPSCANVRQRGRSAVWTRR
jgi:hypothetical protein